MHPLLLVMAGGAIGAGARYEVGRLALARLGPGFPWGTLAVNLIGGLLAGLVVGVASRFPGSGGAWPLFLAVGMLGGFTTFSAFGVETWLMIETGRTGTAVAYALGSVLGAVALTALGLAIARTFG